MAAERADLNFFEPKNINIFSLRRQVCVVRDFRVQTLGSLTTPQSTSKDSAIFVRFTVDTAQDLVSDIISEETS